MKNKNKSLTNDLNDFKDMLKENMSDEYKDSILTLNIIQLQRELITINCATQAIIRTLLDTEGSIFTKETLDKAFAEANDKMKDQIKSIDESFKNVKSMVDMYESLDDDDFDLDEFIEEAEKELMTELNGNSKKE